MKYKAAIFDLDGTVLNTFEDIKGSVNRSLGRCGLPLKTDYEIKQMIGMGVDEFINAAMPADTPETLRRDFRRVFIEEYTSHQDEFTCPFEGIAPMLKSLSAAGIKTAVVSNKDEPLVIGLCEKHFDGLFDLVIGSRPGIPKKPAPDLVYIALDSLSVGKNEAVYIGDTEFDIDTAKNSGTDCIAVLWGFRTKEQLVSCGAKNFADTPERLIEMIK